MKRNNFISSVTTNTTGVDAVGEAVLSKGYTSSDTAKRDSSGKYVFENPKEIDIKSDKCYAKEVTFRNGEGKERQRFYIKHNSLGNMFNPWGMFDEGTQSQYDKNRGKLSWSFKEVSKECFEFYSRFLQSKNNAWLKNAEREIN
jgi:N-acetylmuramoyl-L-alanine amidase CwlA